MEADTETALTLEDVAILADGTGNIPDDTAERLRPFILESARLAEPLARLRQMAADAGTQLFADGYNARESLGRLRERPWKRPTDVLDPALDVPFHELIPIAGALAENAEGPEKAELLQLKQRLVGAFGDDLGAQQAFGALLDQLLRVDEETAEAAVRHLVDLYRLRRDDRGR